MELNIRPPDQLIIDETSTSMRHVWENWIENLENFFLATDITDIKRKKALLLYVGGEELRKIYKTLGDTGTDYASAKSKLEAYFKPKSNITFERHIFFTTLPLENESTSSYVTRLKEKANRCDFNN